MTRVTCRLTAKNQDQLRNPTLGTRVLATFTFFTVAACLLSLVWYRHLIVTIVYFLDSSSSLSDSSEESVPEEDEYEDETEEEEEPLVRCKRPMCAMYCEFGFKKDSTGCPICECLAPAESDLIGRPDGHEAGPRRPVCRGPQPMCANYCPHGYRYNDEGCMTCECVVAATGAPAARAQRPRCRGPMPMCANFCPGGYKYKPDGCMTCECVDNCMVSASFCQFCECYLLCW